MDPIADIQRLDLQTVIDSVYGVERQLIRNKILLETATHDEIKAHYENHDPLDEVIRQDLNEAETRLVLQHYDATAFANYLGGLALLYDTSSTERAARDTEHTQRLITLISNRLISPEQISSPHLIDHRIIDLHNAYAGTTNSDNIHLLDPEQNQMRLIGAHSLRSGISDMQAIQSLEPATPSEIVSFNLAIQAAGGIVFGSMLRLSANKFNYDGSINRENLSQLLQTTKTYVAPALSQTDEIFSKDQSRDFGMACAVLERALQGCSSADLSNALVKGDLHEVLWLLDTFSLMKGNPERYGRLRVIAADHAEDRGKIEGLTLRRGHDFRIYNRDNGKGIRPQLKSHNSRRHDKPYAEAIDVYRESDFHTSIQNPTRFTDKLASYCAWSQSGFDPEMFRTLGLESIIMPTVKEALEAVLE